MGNLQPMFEDFKKLSGVKKIMSFGGWSFSTEADTAPIFRQGVSQLAVRSAGEPKADFVLQILGHGCAANYVREQCREVC
jgi:hypothetical protein